MRYAGVDFCQTLQGLWVPYRCMLATAAAILGSGLGLGRGADQSAQDFVHFQNNEVPPRPRRFSMSDRTMHVPADLRSDTEIDYDGCFSTDWEWPTD